MSDQGAAPAVGASEGVPAGTGAVGASGVETRPSPPEIDSAGEAPPAWLGPIEQRMNELAEQNAQLVQQIQGNQYDGYDDGDLSDLSDAELAESLGMSEQELAEALAEVEDPDYVEDPINQFEVALDRRLDEQRGEQAIVQRDETFDELRSAYPILQDDRTGTAIVHEALRRVMAADPKGGQAFVRSPGFVNFIETTLLDLTARGTLDQIGESEGPSRTWQHEVRTPEVELMAGGGGVGSGKLGEGQPKQIDWGQRIEDAAKRLRPNI